MVSLLNKFLFTEKADLDTSATMIRTNDHVRIGDRIFWVSRDPDCPRPFILRTADRKERGWLFYAIEVEDKVALERIKEIGVFIDLDPAQIEDLSSEMKMKEAEG